MKIRTWYLFPVIIMFHKNSSYVYYNDKQTEVVHLVVFNK
jgi:hypothetical protein